ncbi:hypothetical protein VULLAG_LOCUS21725 [Vulpes lagopus]
MTEADPLFSEAQASVQAARPPPRARGSPAGPARRPRGQASPQPGTKAAGRRPALGNVLDELQAASGRGGRPRRSCGGPGAWRTAAADPPRPQPRGTLDVLPWILIPGRQRQQTPSQQ